MDICSFAWIIRFPNGVEAQGGGIFPGPEGKGSAYRAELGGILAQVVIIQLLEKSGFDFKDEQVCIACDGESALFTSLHRWIENTSRPKTSAMT